jgi:hypothetical protein
MSVEYLYLEAPNGPLCYYEDSEQEIGDYILFESVEEVEDFIDWCLTTGAVHDDFFELAEIGEFTEDMLEPGENTVMARDLFFDGSDIKRVWRN